MVGESPVDRHRASDIEALGMRAVATNTIMHSKQDKVDLAKTLLELAKAHHGRR